MYTNVHKIYDQPPRHAEQTQARDHLERHDAKQQGRGRKQRNPQNNEQNETTATIISVRALLSFLDTLLESRVHGPLTRKTEPLDYKIQQEFNLENGEDTAPRAISAQAARAASLYQSASRANKNNILLETTDKAGAAPEINLNAADMRTIDHLRAELQKLNRQNIQTLKIHRASNFLASLENAITAANQ